RFDGTPHCRLRRLHGIVNNGDTPDARRDLFEHLQHLSAHREFSIRKAGYISTRLREAGDKATPDGINDLDEDGRDSVRHTLERGQCQWAPGADQIRLQRGEFRCVAAYLIEISSAPSYINRQAGPVL